MLDLNAYTPLRTVSTKQKTGELLINSVAWVQVAHLQPLRAPGARPMAAGAAARRQRPHPAQPAGQARRGVSRNSRVKAKQTGSARAADQPPE